MPQKLDSEYWDTRWKEGKTGWDIGHASPAITEFFAQEIDKSAAILIPGCGNAYEATSLANMGFKNITLVDISAEAVIRLQNKFGQNPSIKIVHGDFFAIDQQYDYLVEQTFFCALHPSRRQEYVQQAHSILRPNGVLVGLLFNRSFDDDGPPFGGSVEEYQKLFQTLFHIRTMSPSPLSIPARRDKEVFVKMQAKS
ncbi:MAG: methyltransferase domain-containing protein [Weeksellaceae bacterium]|nr:methyltransferase domain-containing protein [Weeksellaceae bacterium]